MDKPSTITLLKVSLVSESAKAIRILYKGKQFWIPKSLTSIYHRKNAIGYSSILAIIDIDIEEWWWNKFSNNE